MSCLRLNMAPFGVKVLCIEPGFFKTNVTDAGILSKSVSSLWEKLPQEVRDDYGQDYMPKGKFGSSLFLMYAFIHNLSLHLFHVFLFSIKPTERQSGQDERCRSDEGGQLYGACRLCREAPYPLLPGLGRQAVLAAAVVHAELCLRLHPNHGSHSYCQADEINICFYTPTCAHFIHFIINRAFFPYTELRVTTVTLILSLCGFFFSHRPINYYHFQGHLISRQIDLCSV